MCKNLLIILIVLGFLRCNDVTKDNIQTYLKLAENDTLSKRDRLKYIELSNQLNEFTKDDSLYIINKFKISNRYWNIGYIEKFKDINYEILQKSKIKHFKAQANLNLGDYYGEKNNNDSAYLHFKRAEELFRIAKNKDGLVNSIIKKGQIEYAFSEYYRAEKSATITLKLINSNPKKFLETYMALNLLGNICMDLRNYEGALIYHQKSLDLFQTINKQSITTQLAEVTYLNMGLVYQKQSKHDKAIAYFKKTMANGITQAKNPGLYANLIDAIAYSKLKRYGIIDSLSFKRALEINDKLELYDRKAKNFLHLAYLNMEVHNFGKAIFYSKAALREASKCNCMGLSVEALKLLMNLETDNKKYHERYFAIVDSLSIKNLSDHNRFSKVEFETQNLINQKNQAVKQKYILLITSGVALMMIILISIILLQKSRQNVLKLEHDYYKANEEIYQLVLNSQKKSEKERKIERDRIARELHDGIMNRLTSVRFKLFFTTDNEEVKRCANDIQDIEKELHDISHNLINTKIFEATKFNKIIENLIHELQFKKDIKIHFDSNADLDFLPTKHKIEIYRMIQESVRNAIKHSECKNISIQIKTNKETLCIEISDDGKGFQVGNAKSGMGLQNLRFRAKKIEGAVEIKSDSDGSKILIYLNHAKEDKNPDRR